MGIKKKLRIAAIAVAVAGILYWIYVLWVSPTRIATLNFPDFTVEKFVRSSDNPFISIHTVDMNSPRDITKYDMVLVRVHGNTLDSTHLSAIREAIDRGIPVLSTEYDNTEINSLSGRELEYLSTLMENASVKNYRSMFNYIRRNIDGKKVSLGTYEEPMIVPQDYFFHLGEDMFFSTYEEYQAFYEKSGRYNENAPRVVLLSGNINMQNSNEEHMAALINLLEEKGLNVYPIYSFGMKKLGMISAVHPDVIINRPHGRLVMGGGESGVELLKRLNVPILSPVTISEPYTDYLKDAQGMSASGMASMSIVMPELDGAIAPYAIAAQFPTEDGRMIFDSIPVHTAKFASLVHRYATLRTKAAADKKVAVYYLKGAGKSPVSAADIEGVQSLYNTLRLLKENGYDVTGLPDSAEKLQEMIQKSGAVLGPYAHGAYDEFLKNGAPELIPVEKYMEWAEDVLPDTLIKDMEARYGKAPGEYMGYKDENGSDYIAVARIRFGNVVILPQPMPSVGEDVEKLIHGVKGAPAYPYVASYLWTRKGFQADAVIHFGTHGSLEFIPGKQVALSDYDWSDVLIGDMPHFYIYTINNIGEGVVAKRRTYATLISHLTSPFMQAELHGEYIAINDMVKKYETVTYEAIKEEYRKNIASEARKLDILTALSIDTTLTSLSDEDIKRIHIYLEEINGAKVIDGLYTLGEPYTRENVDNTARLIARDPIRYALADIDIAHGRMQASQREDLTYIIRRYADKTERAISSLFGGEDAARVFSSLVSAADMKKYEDYVTKKKIAASRRESMMAAMMNSVGKEEKAPSPFLDEKGNIIPAEEEHKDTTAAAPAMTVMQRMAQATPEGLSSSQSTDEALISALVNLREAVDNVITVRKNIAESTSAEQKSLLNALSGGYVHPSSAGDPIVNPAAVPTGKNFYSINPEATPSAQAWQVGKRLADELLKAELKSTGKYPEKVSFSLWATDFISTQGTAVAQILYLLGVEPLRDGFGYIRSLRLIPMSELGRPRVDVVVQTSGQLRDIASSRLALIQKAVRMAASAEDENNYVKKGMADAEKLLLSKGFSPVDARKYSAERIFGGVNGSYGTGIMGMVEDSENWEDNSQLAERYISNMSALYSDDGGTMWGQAVEGVFEAALLNASVVVQPRSSNTWGPLSLDHVYEFMGGMSSAIQKVTGNDPRAYFNDMRSSTAGRIQELSEAIGVETQSTVFNPKYISEMMKGEASAMGHFAETFRNTFGWNSLKPSSIDQYVWDGYYDVYVQDKYDMKLHESFEDKNPYALQEMTAVMLESARKGMWEASEEQIRNTAELHASMVEKHSAGCTGFICDNAALREYISARLTQKQSKAYNAAINSVREVQTEITNSENAMTLKKEEMTSPENQPSEHRSGEESSPSYLLYMIIAVAVVIGIWVISKRNKN